MYFFVFGGWLFGSEDSFGDFMCVEIVGDVDADILLLCPALRVRKGLAWFFHFIQWFKVVRY